MHFLCIVAYVLTFYLFFKIILYNWDPIGIAKDGLHCICVSHSAEASTNILPQLLDVRSWGVRFRGFVTFFLFFVLPLFKYYSAVWCSVVDAHLKQLDRVVTGARFLTGGVLECDFTHRRSVAVLWMLYKIRCNSMPPLYGTLPVPYMCKCRLQVVLW